MLVPYGVVMSETSSWKGALLQKKKGWKPVTVERAFNPLGGERTHFEVSPLAELFGGLLAQGTSLRNSMWEPTTLPGVAQRQRQQS